MVFLEHPVQRSAHFPPPFLFFFSPTYVEARGKHPGMCCSRCRDPTWPAGSLGFARNHLWFVEFSLSRHLFPSHKIMTTNDLFGKPNGYLITYEVISITNVISTETFSRTQYFHCTISCISSVLWGVQCGKDNCLFNVLNCKYLKLLLPYLMVLLVWTQSCLSTFRFHPYRFHQSLGQNYNKEEPSHLHMQVQPSVFWSDDRSHAYFGCNKITTE